MSLIEGKLLAGIFIEIALNLLFIMDIPIQAHDVLTILSYPVHKYGTSLSFFRRALIFLSAVFYSFSFK